MSKYRTILTWGGAVVLLVFIAGCFFLGGYVVAIQETESQYTQEVASLDTTLHAISSYYEEHRTYPLDPKLYYSNNSGMLWAGSGPDYVLFYSGVGAHRIIRISFLEDGKVSVTRGTKRQMQENTQGQ